ncbi:Poly-beta-1,6-N-acetyl-D-glucosamine N-deacetylase precursor [Providencia rustigianii]|uniref:Poly-beta-1,6-N-acetyl-D-glucosamine N-deacetylase n=1 Tax=Providencia rustigianii TaxID=158850 RepID=A0A379G7B5_9GAMM|nr:polysaccharide deacetylase family protein [Providencia rustigianii]SUC36944.1 Poly-beta-1,6-N-acetyl-D-glucosamine N-deacetylase precursor [Providencia rustigianii]
MSNRLLTLFFFLLLGPLSISYAEDTNDNNVVIIGSKAINIDNWEVVDLPPKLIQTKQPEVIFAPIAGKMRVVGELNPDHGFYAYNPNGSYNALQFGNDYAYIKTAQLSNKKPRNLPSDDRLNDLQNPVYDYLITTQKTPVYAGIKENSPQIASLWEDLRYPVLARMINTDNDGEKTAWLTIRLGDRLGYIRLDDVSIDKGIPILTYHHILEDSENKNFRHTSTTTSVAAFREQMDYLKEQGYQTISLDDVEGYLEKKANLPGKAVALTFDDGLKSVYRYALPILRNNQQQATLFVISSRVKTKPQQWNPDSLQFMCKQEIKDSQDVFNIQSHTHFLHRLDNRNNPIIFSRKEHTIMLDFKRSMKELAKFEPNQRALAYPFGAYNQTAIQAGKEAGLRLAVTTIQGKVRLGDNPFALKRLYAYSTDPISKFALMVGNGEETVVNKNVVVDK